MNKNLLKELIKKKLAFSGTLIELLPGTLRGRAGDVRVRIIEAAYEAMGEIMRENKREDAETAVPTRIPVE